MWPECGDRAPRRVAYRLAMRRARFRFEKQRSIVLRHEVAYATALRVFPKEARCTYVSLAV